MWKFVCLLALACAVSASDVLEFTDGDFKDRVDPHEVILVEFFAPWCGHCKRLAPEYEKAATSLKNNDPPVPLAKVDCTANEKICKEYDVSGYPTLKIFKGGKLSKDYDGPREADGIVQYMRKLAGPSSKELLTVDDFNNFALNDKSTDFVVVGFFSDAKNDLATTFKNTADTYDKVRFAHTTAKEILDKLNYKDDIVLFQPKVLNNKFEEAALKYTDDVTLYKLKNWLSTNVIGLCGVRTQNNADSFGKPLVVAFFDVDYTKNPKGTNYWRNRVMKVAKKFRDAGEKLYFAISNQNEFAHELGENGLTASSDGKPVVAARDTKDRKFIMSTEFSMDNLEKFVDDVLNDRLEPYMKSEPVPDNTNEAVKVAVAKNFDELVNDDSKDVLVEFYAPWCGHCKSLEPKYKELAEKLKDEQEIAIVKMDATANDVPKPYEVQGFPTLYFKPKGSPDSPKKYQGGREVDDFVKFLARESTNELSGFDRNGKKKKKAKKTEL